MEVEVVKEYIDIDYMIESVISILKEARDDFKDDEQDTCDFLDLEFSDQYLEERAMEQAFRWNDNMKKCHSLLPIRESIN